MNTPTTSPLNTAQWTNLEKLANAAHEALSALSTELLINSRDADEPLATKMQDESKKIHDFQFVTGYLLHPQSEWLGGESYVLREPHFAGVLPRRTVED